MGVTQIDRSMRGLRLLIRNVTEVNWALRAGRKMRTLRVQMCGWAHEEDK